jgi:hypothetical protein
MPIHGILRAVIARRTSTRAARDGRRLKIKKAKNARIIPFCLVMSAAVRATGTVRVKVPARTLQLAGAMAEA